MTHLDPHDPRNPRFWNKKDSIVRGRRTHCLFVHTQGALVYLSLGSNVGDREGFLAGARKAIENAEGLTVLKRSSVLGNPALLVTEQPDFLNQILAVHTALPPLELLAFLKGTEARLGRRERFRWGPREIDLDILTYGDLRLHTPELTLPHPGLHDREFLRTLLAEFGETPESIGGGPAA